MINSDVDLDEQAQKTITEIHCYCEARVYVSVKAVMYEYEIYKN